MKQPQPTPIIARRAWLKATAGAIANLLVPQAAGATAGATLAGAEGGIEDGGKRSSQLRRLLAEKVKAEPETASRLVQNWVEEEERR